MIKKTTGSDPELAARPPSAQPSHFVAKIGGFMGRSFEVALEGNSLMYRMSEGAYKWGAKERLVVSEKRWADFNRALSRVRAWNWAAHYPNPGVMDGTGWSLEVEWDGRLITSGGDNNYPGDLDLEATQDLEPSKLFEAYLRAVRALIEREFE